LIDGRIHHRQHGIGVGQVGLDDDVTGARYFGRDLGGQLGRCPVMDRDPVARRRELRRDRPSDAARRPP
jgi:hypothetical protein